MQPEFCSREKTTSLLQSVTIPYNPCGNSICERFNCTLLDLIKTLPKEQKANWPLHIPPLVFTYNTMPHSITGCQPYELMFGSKAPTLWDAWLGLAHYNGTVSTNKHALLNEQHELLMSANRQALKHIRQSAKRLELVARDHSEGQNKLQDNYKSELFVIVAHHEGPNVYIIQPLNKKVPKRTVNRQLLFDLKKISGGSDYSRFQCQGT